MNINSNISNISSYIGKDFTQAVKMSENLTKSFDISNIENNSYNEVNNTNFGFAASYIEPSNSFQVTKFASELENNNFAYKDQKAKQAYKLETENNEETKAQNSEFSFIDELGKELSISDKISIYQQNQEYNQISKINETVQNFKNGYQLRNDALNSYKSTQDLTMKELPKFEYMHKYNDVYEEIM